MDRRSAADENPAQAAVADYIERLRRASADLPDGPREELVDNISAHLEETSGGATTEAQVRTALDELGTPEEVAAAAREESGSRPARTDTGLFYDVAAVLVLLVGGFVVPVVGWFAGVVMLWAGPRWTGAQKVVGTLAWPLAAVVLAAALGVPVLFASSRPVVLALLALGVLAVLVGLPAVFVHLLRSANSKRA